MYSVISKLSFWQMEFVLVYYKKKIEKENVEF